jgi:L-ascorbate metabolism protein UlaG (beta-lactamase superfamily)
MNVRTAAAFCCVIGVFTANALAQTPFELRSVRRLTNGEVAIAASLPNSVNYRIEAAEIIEGNTNATSWHGFLTVPPGPSSLQHTDSATPYLQQRYYRARELAGNTNFTGDHITTTNGDVIIQPVNHASVVLKWNDVTIYNDVVGSATLYALYPRPSLVLVSHTHGDHYSATTLDSVRNSSTMILAPQAVWNSMNAGLRSVTGVLTNWMTTNVLGIHVQAIPAYNGNHALGAGNGYVVTIGGRRFLFSGDTGPIAELRALQNIDVAFLCMNIPFTMNVTDAASVLRDMRPRIVYPYHYRNQDGTFADLNDLKRRVGQDLGIEVRVRKWY